MRIPIEHARESGRRAILDAGATAAVAASLAGATIAAERHGRHAVGFAHLTDYLAGFDAGRIAATAVPEISFPVPAAITVDAGGSLFILALAPDILAPDLPERLALQTERLAAPLSDMLNLHLESGCRTCRICRMRVAESTSKIPFEKEADGETNRDRQQSMAQCVG